MDTDTYHNADVAKYLNENFVNVLIDTDNDKATTKKFKVNAIPDTRILDGTEKELLRIVGHRAEFFDQVRALGDVAAVEKKLNLNPGDIPTLLEVADTYVKLGRGDEAGKLFEKVIETDADNKSGRLEEAWYKLGLVHQKADRNEEAEAAWAHVAQMDPDNKKGFNDDIQFARCQKQVDEEDWGNAENSLANFLKLPEGEHVPDARFLLGLAQFWNEKKEEAISTWKDLIRAFPDSPAAKKAEKSLKYAEKKGR